MKKKLLASILSFSFVMISCFSGFAFAKTSDILTPQTKNLLDMPIPTTLNSIDPKTSPVDIRLDGAFIQPMLYNNYSDIEWNKELELLKSIGVKELIMGDVVEIFEDSQWKFFYKSNLPEFDNGIFFYEAVDNILSNCKKHDIKVYLGMGLDPKWWKQDLSTASGRAWFEKFTKQSVRVTTDIFDLYKSKYPETFHGFYAVPEIWNHISWNNTEKRTYYADTLSAGFNALIDNANSLDPTMPIIFSPFATRNGFASRENVTKFYTELFEKTNFREIDAMTPMDNCGGGGQILQTVEDWTKAYKDAYTKSGTKLQFWANNENFIQSGSYPLGKTKTWGTATIDRYIEQIRITSKYATKKFSFAYSHYYSPVVAVGGYHETYLEYVKTGVLDSEKPLAPSKIKSKSNGKYLQLQWSGDYDNKGISKVNIYKNGEFYDFVNSTEDSIEFCYQTAPRNFTDMKYDAKEVNTYEVETVDCAGNVSSKRAKIVVTPDNNDNKVVLDKLYQDIWDEKDPMGLIRPIMPGDVNKDKSVSTMDALIILKSIAKLQELNNSEKESADINDDQKINTSDALTVLKNIASIDTGLTK